MPAPSVTSTTPPQIIATSTDTDVVVAGAGFTAKTTATFGGTPAKVAFVSSSMVTVTLPASMLGAIGNLDLVLTNPPLCGSSKISLSVRSPASLNPAGWPRHHHDNQNTSATSSIVAPSPKLAWKKFTSAPSSGVLSEGGGFWSGPVVGRPGKSEADVVFVGAPDGTIFSFAQDGAAIYHFTGVGANVYGVDGVAAVRSDGTLYVGVSDAILYAIKPDGTKLWSYTTGQTSDGSAAIAEDGTILYSSDDDHVYALTPDGKPLWNSAAAGEVDSALATSTQAFGTTSPILVFLGGQNGWYCLDGATGAEKWHVAATGLRGASVSSPVIDKDGTLFGVDSGGLAVHIDGFGKVLWSKQIAAGGAGATPALVGDHLYAIGFDGILRALKTSDGSVVWQADVKGTAPSSGELPAPAVDGAGDVFVYSPDGNIHRFAADGTPKGTIAAAPALQEFVMPQLAIGFDGAIYVSGSDGNLSAFK